MGSLTGKTGSHPLLDLDVIQKERERCREKGVVVVGAYKLEAGEFCSLSLSLWKSVGAMQS